MMNRRSAICLALGGFVGIQGCRKRGDGAVATDDIPLSEVTPKLPKKMEGSSLVPVTVDPERVIRTIGGLRPYRASGFVVRRDEVGGKALIHNYGHGGGGMTLSWGSAHLAVEMAGEVSGKDCAVVGGGVMGLSTARLLQLHGAKVTLYTDELPPNTTSNVAGAQWWPFSVFDDHRRTEAFGRQYVAAAKFSYEYFQRLVGPRWGVKWLPNYYLSQGPPRNGWISGPGGVLRDLQIGLQDFAPGEHVFSNGYARRFHTMMIEPSVYLAELLAEVQAAGARVEIRKFMAGNEVLGLPEPIIFNCTGLGAKPLFGDEELMPIKGQLSFLMPQPEVNYNLITETLYMFPRADGILLGGSYEKGQWNAEPDSAVRDAMVKAHQALFEGMRKIQNENRG